MVAEIRSPSPREPSTPLDRARSLVATALLPPRRRKRRLWHYRGVWLLVGSLLLIAAVCLARCLEIL